MAILFSKYIIKDGDRWDTVAYHQYGDASLYPVLIADNPHLSIINGFEVGEVMFIRSNQDDIIVDKVEDLPPWMQ